MSNQQDAPLTLFEIVNEVLLQFTDANLLSDEARKRIADEICDRYYSDIEMDSSEIPPEDFLATFEYFDDDDMESGEQDEKS